ncbi:phage protein GemA/Gp16 family protein [Paraburkholderia sp. BR14312]
MDEGSYRAMLRSVGAVDSSKDLDPAGAAKVLQHLERCGFKPKGGSRRPRVALPRAAQLRKIEAMLADAGRPWEYLAGMVKRICKVDAIEFCDSDMLGKLIAALQLDANRRGKRS